MFKSKKIDPFFAELLKIAKNVNEAALFSFEFKFGAVADIKEFSIKLRNYETEGDRLVNGLIIMLKQSFMTPIERDDILMIALKMDDVLDGLEHFAFRLDMYSIEKIDDPMREMTGYITKSTEEIVKAVKLLSTKKFHSMFEPAALIKDYERHCEEIFRTSMKQLFIKGKDPIRIIQIKDIYEELEDIANHCQDVANTIESIIMRNA